MRGPCRLLDGDNGRMNKVWLRMNSGHILGIYTSEAAAKQDAWLDDVIHARQLKVLRYCIEPGCDWLAGKNADYCREHNPMKVKVTA